MDGGFDHRTESPTTLLWLRLPGLKIHLFDQELLFALGMVYGKPIKNDTSTMNLTRPSEARILIKRDITLPFSGEIWIGTQYEGFWQQTELEQIPLYCTHCRIFGHSLSQCYQLHPNLKPSRKNASRSAPPHTCPSSAPECIPQTIETPVDTMPPLPPTIRDNTLFVLPIDILADVLLGPDNQDSIEAPHPQDTSGVEDTHLPSLQNQNVVTTSQELGAHSLLHAQQSVDHTDQMSKSSDEEWQVYTSRKKKKNGGTH
ncbi:uncharacterized protein LOC110037195 [Phalaenopsis equestris]|uniref:uncharacterized protein LOC110037195 n=1 Tax=Phalaenopsis equestris TaxID=78828 RepID=UPI0009E5FEE7|nr:uncharacterized protein LOC110037195 [Phalaenopsis equestris]